MELAIAAASPDLFSVTQCAVAWPSLSAQALLARKCQLEHSTPPATTVLLPNPFYGSPEVVPVVRFFPYNRTDQRLLLVPLGAPYIPTNRVPPLY